MQINPFNIPLDKLMREQTLSIARIAELRQQLDWYCAFKPETANARYLAIARGNLSTATRDEAAHLSAMRERLSDLRIVKINAEEEAKLELDPRSWFSSERTVANRAAAQLGKQFEELKSEIDALQAATTERDQQLSEESATLRNSLDTYRTFDQLQVQAELAARTKQMALREDELLRLKTRKGKLDSIIAPLCQRLDAERARRATIERDKRKANDLNDRLAASNANRGAIHQECERTFNNGSPSKVIRELRGKLDPVIRNIAKLEQRIADEVRKSQLDVREVVIDGNNMVYEGKRFIGLHALDAIVPVLATRCVVKINFDPGLHRRVGLGTAAIRARYPMAELHFLPHGMQADPFVLKHAEGKPHTFVLSNDKFVEYLDKEAVQQGRILRFVIANNTVQLPDLDICAELRSEADV